MTTKLLIFVILKFKTLDMIMPLRQTTTAHIFPGKAIS